MPKTLQNYKKETFCLGKKPIADFYYKKDKESELGVFQNFEKKYEELIEFFGVQPPKIKIKLIYTRKEMNEHWGSKSEVTAMVDNKDPYQIYIFSPLVFERLTSEKKKVMFLIILHEIAHAFVTQLNKRCFAWANEGVCEFITGDNIRNNIVKKKDWSWFKENEVLLNPTISWRELMKHDGYKISYNLVKYIIKKYEKKAIFSLIKIRRIKNKNIKRRINKILGGDFDKFLVNFEKTLKLR